MNDASKLLPFEEGDVSDEDAAQLGWEAGRTIGWDTPEMAEYDEYDRFQDSTQKSAATRWQKYLSH